jgi:hypothetical protein
MLILICNRHIGAALGGLGEGGCEEGAEEMGGAFAEAVFREVHDQHPAAWHDDGGFRASWYPTE